LLSRNHVISVAAEAVARTPGFRFLVKTDLTFHELLIKFPGQQAKGRPLPESLALNSTLP
jgi:hypothetical protein